MLIRRLPNVKSSVLAQATVVNLYESQESQAGQALSRGAGETGGGNESSSDLFMTQCDTVDSPAPACAESKTQ